MFCLAVSFAMFGFGKGKKGTLLFFFSKKCSQVGLSHRDYQPEGTF